MDSEGSRNVDSGDAVQPPMLPFDLLHLVAQHVIGLSIVEKDKEIMKTCSLAFSGWRIPFQRALFKITKVPYLLFSEFTENVERRRIDKLRDLLNANPDFQQAITSIRLRVLDTGTLPGSTPEFTASLLSQLRSIDTVAICQNQQHPVGRRHTWTGLSEEARGALIDLFRCPSIRHLYIQSFDAPLAVTFLEGAERDTVRISCSRSLDLQDDSHLLDGSGLNDWDATKSSLRPCIVRHLTSVPPIASKLLRATRDTGTSQGGITIRTPFVDSSAIYSLEMEGEDTSGGLRDLRAVLHRTNNLRKLTVWGDGLDGLFQEPQPACLASSLEVIEFTFKSGINTTTGDSEPAKNLINLIMNEFSVYPPTNVLKKVILTIPLFKRVYVLPLAERLHDALVALGDLFGKTGRFPFLECVEVIPELDYVNGPLGELSGLWDWDWEVGTDGIEYRKITTILGEVTMEAHKMGLGSKFSVRMSDL